MKEILEKRINKGEIGVWWIGQGGFIFKEHNGKIVVIDPYLSNIVGEKHRLQRIVEIPYKPEDVKADILLCTHDDLDHADPETIRKMKDIKVYIGPPSVCKIYKECGISENKIYEIKRGEEKLFFGIKIIATFSKHKEDSIGYVLIFDRIKIYITGDTEFDEKLFEVKKFNPDIMFVCINGKWGNMNYKEAVKLTKEIKPKIVIPMHYGMFKENTADPNLFIEELKKEKVDVEGRIIEFNKVFIYGGEK